MSATAPTSAVPTPTTPARVAGVLAAIAGRFGWRLWWPIPAWLLAAALARAGETLHVYAPGEPGRWSTTAAGVLFLGGVAAIPVLFLWGARYALGLGHDRAVVYGVTAATGLLLQPVLHLVSLTAAWAEHRVVGAQGVHVFALETSNVFGTWDTVWNGTWLLGLFYVLPLLAMLVCASAALARWGARGLLGLVAIPLVVLAAGALLSAVDAGPVAVAVSLAVLVGSLVGGWFIFRRVAV